MVEMYEKSQGMSKIPLWIYVLEDIYDRIQRKRQINDKYVNVKEAVRFTSNYKNL